MPTLALGVRLCECLLRQAQWQMHRNNHPQQHDLRCAMVYTLSKAADPPFPPSAEAVAPADAEPRPADRCPANRGVPGTLWRS